MAKLKNYDFKQVNVVFAGKILTGFSESGDCVLVEKSEDAFTHHVGADGEEARAKSNNDSGKVTIKLSQYSSSNKDLADLHLADLASGAGIQPIMIVDKSGNSLHGSDEAYIAKAPNAPYSKAPGDREWVIMCSNMKHYVGGN